MMVDMVYGYTCTACDIRVQQPYRVDYDHPHLPMPCLPAGWRVIHWSPMDCAVVCPGHTLHLTLTVDGKPHEVTL